MWGNFGGFWVANSIIWWLGQGWHNEGGEKGPDSGYILKGTQTRFVVDQTYDVREGMSQGDSKIFGFSHWKSRVVTTKTGQTVVGAGLGGQSEGPVKCSVWDVLSLRCLSHLQMDIQNSSWYMGTESMLGVHTGEVRNQQYTGCI